ncbi:hypothetical protein B7R78_0018575 [Ralstonia solanacearum]|uniref:hypothetical protein n=1 Tax=Ralstonia solanacearum species complex TaxID=3116862 RepID=UPI001140527C|nr:hypothetical protein [Ralstonia solanacearum]MBT1539024.1 hypothetical protein [Ralstonia solanacearum]QOK84738.1 hypothetical protein HF906_22205 [Ralstonia solanacearum]
MSSREPTRFQIRARECWDSRLTGKAPAQGAGGLLKPFRSPGDQSTQANSNKTPSSHVNAIVENKDKYRIQAPPMMSHWQILMLFM